jgi:hypothetical protein
LPAISVCACWRLLRVKANPNDVTARVSWFRVCRLDMFLRYSGAPGELMSGRLKDLLATGADTGYESVDTKKTQRSGTRSEFHLGAHCVLGSSYFPAGSGVLKFKRLTFAR